MVVAIACILGRASCLQFGSKFQNVHWKPQFPTWRADYSYRYHTLDNPVVSDSAYDALVRELKELESQLFAEASGESVTGKDCLGNTSFAVLP
ncbi:hypothetical protein M758_UG213800 [Ceratodon purpureus]|nr:hypothetical protein M758_UG213800 [Ceratodon purpureus]